MERATAPFWLCWAAVLLTSAGALTLEIVAGRMLAPYVGMSLYTWTAVIAVVLAGLSVGHWLGGEVGNEGRGQALAATASILAASALSTALAPLLIRLTADRIVGPGVNPVAGIVVLTATLFFLPSLFVGMVSPILTRLAVERSDASAGRVIARMYAAGAGGSIAGTLAAGYLFIAWLGSIGTVMAVAGIYALLAGLFAVLSGSRAGRMATAALLVIAGLVVGIAQARDALASACTRESDYYCIRIVDMEEETGAPSGLMVLDHMGHGVNDRDRPQALHMPYIALADRLTEAHGVGGPAFSAFFIGGGAYSLPRAWAARWPKSRLTVAEVDPAVTALARERLWLTDSPAIRVLHRDGRMALRDDAATDGYDVIMGDAFHDFSVPQHLVTQEFAELARNRLKPDGILIQNVVDQARHPLFLFSLVRTFDTVFPVVEVWVDAEQMRGSERLTFVILAGAVPTPTARLTGRADGPDPQREWFRWPDALLRQEMAAAPTVLLTDDHAPVDRLLASVFGEGR